MIDFSQVQQEGVLFYDFAQRFTVEQMRAATLHSIGRLLDLVRPLNDAQVTFAPDDPNANDPFAPEHERYLGWSVAHLVMHVTASSEEWAGIASILARGIPYPREPRLRYETDWHVVTTQAQVIQRLEESRRMRLAYLDAFPDKPHYDVFQDISERWIARNGRVNARAAFLQGLRHEVGHWEQIQEAARQAREAIRV